MSQEIPKAVHDQVVKRMEIGVFQKESLIPIAKAFHPDGMGKISDTAAAEIIDRIIDFEKSAGSLTFDSMGFGTYSRA